MTKYLALAATKYETAGICFYDDLEKIIELSTFPLSKIEERISYYQPKYLLYSSSKGLRANYRIAEIKNNFPSLEVVHVSGISDLSDRIIDGTKTIPRLERKPGGNFGSSIYPEYYFNGKKIFSKDLRKALFVMYLYKPWQEIGEFKLFKRKQIPITENISSDLNYYQQLKNINMVDLNLEVQELVNKLTEMSKLSYLGGLKSAEILFLVENFRKFAKKLEGFYTLKKSKEDEVEQQQNEGKEETTQWKCSCCLKEGVGKVNQCSHCQSKEIKENINNNNESNGDNN